MLLAHGSALSKGSHRRLNLNEPTKQRLGGWLAVSELTCPAEQARRYAALQHRSTALQANSSLYPANRKKVEVLMKDYYKAGSGSGNAPEPAFGVLFLQHKGAGGILQRRMLCAA